MWLLDRRGHTTEPAHRTKTDVQIHDLPDSHVEAAKTATDRCGQRALDTDQVLLKLVDGRLREPVARLVEGLLTGQDFHPLDVLAVLVCRGIQHELGGWPDIDSGAITFNERNDGVVWDSKRAVFLHRDLFSHDGDRIVQKAT